MKKIILFTMLLILSATSFSQQTNSSQPLTREDHLKKSKKQKTAAWILLGSGAALTFGSIVVVFVEGVGTGVDAVYSGEEESTSSAGGIMFVTGIAAMAGSIPLFIASGKNRRKAAAWVSFKMEKTTIVGVRDISIKRYPAIAFQVRL